MRRAGFVVLIAFGGFVAPLLAQSQGDFSGTWKMDPARSASAHQDVPVQTSTLVIRLSGDALTIETIRKEADKPVPFDEVLHFNLGGPETTGPGDSGTTVTGTARWDGEKLVVETARNIQGSTVTTRNIHTLSADGNEMSIEKVLTIQHGYEGVIPEKTTGRGQDIFVRVPK